jgi:hypothetical protein
MKVEVDGKKVIELNETQKKVIQNDIPDEIFQEDMERRVNWVLSHKYARCFERLKKEWEPKLAQKMDSIPTNPDQFAELVFAQPEYKNRSLREKEASEAKKKTTRGE